MLHPAAEFVRVAENFLLLVAQSLELFLDFLLFGFVSCLLQSRLHFLDAIIEIFLASRKLTEAIENLSVFALLGVLLGLWLCLTLCFVAIVGIG